MNQEPDGLKQENNRLRNEENGIKKRKNNILGIDGLKGLAIIGVTLFHMFPNSVKGGFLGTSLFFLLSGYLLAVTTAKNSVRGRYNIKNYAIRRIRRIVFPMVVMIMFVLGTLYGLIPNTLAGIRSEIISIILGYNNWWQIAQNADYFTRLVNTSPFTHMWFMGIELQYIVIWPVIFWLYFNISKRLSANIALMLLALVTIGFGAIMPLMYRPDIDISRIYFGTDTRVWALLLGAVIGLWHVQRRKTPQSSAYREIFSNIIFASGVVALIVGYIQIDGQNPMTYVLWMPVFTILFGLMVALIDSKHMIMTKLCDMPPFSWLGRHSYGIFLWQYPVIFIFQKMDMVTFFGNDIGYYFSMIGVILLLTVWSDSLSAYFDSLISWDEFIKSMRSYYVKLVTPVAFLIIMVGGIAFCMAPENKQDDMNDLRTRLEANALSQESANERSKEINLSEIEDPKEMVNIVAVGDSVMLGAAPALREDFAGIYIDAKVSRYVGAGLDVFKELDREGKLGNVVIVGLGTNGPITGYYEDETKALVEYLGNKQVYWINNYAPGISWVHENNVYLEKLAKEHPNIVILDWAGLAKEHRDWLGDDGIHPNDIGIKEYSKFVHEEIKKHMVSQLYE